MRGLTAGSIAVACLALTAGAVMLAARGQQFSRPGEIGGNHVLVDNRSPEQAIPVVLQQRPDPPRVQVVGTTTVRVDPTSAVGIRAVRQLWEYRSIAFATGQDPMAALANAGLDGWEAVGFQSGQAGVAVLLKRPR
jgi:hypothetical protein